MASAPSAAPEQAQPKGKAKPTPSGRLLLRMPAELHAQLARAAENRGVSLNSFITSVLAAKVGHGSRPDESVPEPMGDRARLVVLALVANAIVIGLAAAAAIAILVLAWRG